LENWGVDVNELKAKTVKRVLRAWVEKWEKECIKIKDKDAAFEVRLLEKYKGLVSLDPKDKNTYTIELKNMLEWFRASKRKGIGGGWYVVATNDDDEIKSFMIEDELCKQVAGGGH
jgi:hypothetical protein